jgi:hypothetical protein
MEAEVTSSSALKPIKVSTPLLDKAVAMTSKDGQHNIVQSSAVIRAPLMDVLAYLYCLEQAINDLLKEERGVNVHKVLGRENDHTATYHWGIRAPAPLSHRDFVFRCVYKQLAVGEHITSIKSTVSGVAPAQDTVRGTATRLLRFTAVTPTVTRFTATTTMDLGGSIPRFVSAIAMSAGANAPLAALGYFLQIKETADFDAAGQDAWALGRLLAHEMEPVRTKRGGGQLEAKLHVFFYRTTVLREVADVHPWFPTMLFEVLRNLPHRPMTTKAMLADFTERDAVITGRAMQLLMLCNATPDAAVDEVSRERSERQRRRRQQNKNYSLRHRCPPPSFALTPRLTPPPPAPLPSCARSGSSLSPPSKSSSPRTASSGPSCTRSRSTSSPSPTSASRCASSAAPPCPCSTS